MATNFQPRSDIKVAIGSGSANLGTAHVASDTWDFLQVVDFNIEQASAPASDRAAARATSRASLRAASPTPAAAQRLFLCTR